MTTKSLMELIEAYANACESWHLAVVTNVHKNPTVMETKRRMQDLLAEIATRIQKISDALDDGDNEEQTAALNLVIGTVIKRKAKRR